MNTRFLAIGAMILFGATMGATTVDGAIAINQVTNINSAPGFGNVNVFGNPPVAANDAGVFMGNDIVVYTLTAGGGNGGGLSVPLSNGENGIDSTAGGTNTDIPNTEPVHPVFAAIGNASGKLENGNAIRFSVWMRQDPNQPVTKEPQIEPVLKLELWKEALSGAADFSGAAFPGFGDRVWDTDQNAGNPAFNGFNQSQADWVDMNNNGVIANGRPVTTSLVTNEWRLVETTLVVDDDPLNDELGWSIGADFFDVGAIEEIRGVMFVGEFSGQDLSNGGSFWVDNLMLEVFKDEATMLATPNPNTIPVEGIPGDHNGDGSVDAADFVEFRDLGLPVDTWRANFGRTGGSGSVTVAPATQVPEPAAGVLLLLALVSVGLTHRRTVK